MRTWLIILLLAATTGFAAEKKEPRSAIKVNGVEVRELSAPIHQNDNGDDTIQVRNTALKRGGNETWLQISVRYETRPEWLDHLTLEFYVLMPTPSPEGTLFKGVVHYVDIPKGRDHLAEMYMHFNTRKRYSRRGKIRTAVLAKTNGTIVGIDQNNSPEDPWWETAPAGSHALLNRLDTPFRIVNEESYQAQSAK